MLVSCNVSKVREKDVFFVTDKFRHSDGSIDLILERLPNEAGEGDIITFITDDKRYKEKDYKIGDKFKLIKIEENKE
jgi:hypothetical protein